MMLLAQASGQAVTGLNTFGLILMAVTITFVLLLNIFCFWKILTEPDPGEHHHAPLEIDTGDADEPNNEQP
jgi:hypothetical protein